jgi:disulfide bond formation protein DsbB
MTTDPLLTASFPPKRDTAATALAFLAFVMAIVTITGSLYLSGKAEWEWGLGLKACPLCFYQRTFAMAVAGILLVGLVSGVSAGQLCLLALPSAVGGLGTAIFHVYLVQTGKLECPAGIRGIGTAPEQSLASYALLLIPLILASLRTRAAATILALVLGAAFVYGSITFNPAPPKPTKPYDGAPDTCRVPYVEEVDSRK